jgi:hypothetical protein
MDNTPIRETEFRLIAYGVSPWTSFLRIFLKTSTLATF